MSIMSSYDGDKLFSLHLYGEELKETMAMISELIGCLSELDIREFKIKYSKVYKIIDNLCAENELS